METKESDQGSNHVTRAVRATRNLRPSDLCALEVVRRSRHKFGLIGVIWLTHQGQCAATLHLE